MSLFTDDLDLEMQILDPEARRVLVITSWSKPWNSAYFPNHHATEKYQNTVS